MAHHGMIRHNYKISRMSYEDIRSIMEKKQAMQKKGTLTDQEIKKIVDKWKDDREEDELDPKVVEREVKRLEKKFE